MQDRLDAAASPQGPEPSPLLTVPALARYLSLSPRAARRVLERGELPGFHVGRQWFIRPRDLDRALDEKVAASRRDPDAAVRILRGLPGSRKPRRKAAGSP